MRREELLAREAWDLEDAAVEHAIELWKHEERISRLFRPASLPPQEYEVQQQKLEWSKRRRHTQPTDRARENPSYNENLARTRTTCLKVSVDFLKSDTSANPIP